MKGEKCELRVLERNEEEAALFTAAVNAGLTTQALFTGSVPMRDKDYLSKWDAEVLAGDVLFGIWLPYVEQEKHYCTGDLSTTLLPPTWCHTVFPHKPHEQIITPSRQEKFIGTCGLHSHRDIYKSWEARWMIFDPEAVGKGVGKEAVTMLTDYAFRRLNAHRVWLGVSADNLRAVKCYLDCGYKIEGRMVDELFYDGAYHDAYRMAVVR